MRRKTTRLRKREILDVAESIIIAQGFQTLTTRKIAQTIGFTEAAIYRHFSRGKAQILEGLLERWENRWTENLKEVEKHPGSCQEKLSLLLKKHLRLIEQFPGKDIKLFVEIAHTKDKIVKERLITFLQIYLKKVQALLQEGKNKGEIGDSCNPPSGAPIFMGIAFICSLFHMLQIPLPLADDPAETLWNCYARILRKP